MLCALWQSLQKGPRLQDGDLHGQFWERQARLAAYCGMESLGGCDEDNDRNGYANDT